MVIGEHYAVITRWFDCNVRAAPIRIDPALADDNTALRAQQEF
jgi:hypothetical protein